MKQIDGCPDYWASEDGRIFSSKSGNLKEVSQRFNTKGYKVVNLSINGKCVTKAVHRLVAIAFIPNPDNKPTIDHINAVKTDNRVENLRWCTTQENVRNPITLRRLSEHNIKVGQINKVKLAKQVSQYTQEGVLVKTWISASEAARQINRVSSHICDCCNGKANTAYGYIWRYT